MQAERVNEEKPKITVGLPVYNGANYVAEAVESVLAQTYQDWELIISDNCSTDETEAICRGYAARDARIRYYRNERNLGASLNHNLLIERARGEYFKLISHDDYILPTFLEKTLAVMEANPEVVNCHTLTMIIDAEGKVIGPNPWHLRTDSPNPRIRFRDMVCLPHHSFQIYGLMRLSALRQTPLFGVFLSCDQVLMTQLLMMGPFRQVDEYLFYSRRHKKQSISQLPEYMRGKPRTFFGRIGQLPRLGWFDPKLERKIAFPVFRLIWEYSKAAATAKDVGWWTKLGCLAHMVAYTVGQSHKLARDIVVALDQAIQQSWLMERHARRALKERTES